MRKGREIEDELAKPIESLVNNDDWFQMNMSRITRLVNNNTNFY